MSRLDFLSTQRLASVILIKPECIQLHQCTVQYTKKKFQLYMTTPLQDPCANEEVKQYSKPLRT